MKIYKVALLLLLLTLSQQQVQAVTKSEFCWRDSYGRGAGVPLSDCPAGKDKIGLLCYSPCPAGFRRFGFDCHQVCPSDFVDQGLFCRRVEYGRGSGYPWSFGDGFNNYGMLGRCHRDHPAHGCEMWGAIAYPKCRPGYSNFGCCICRPNPFNCESLGFGPNLDISCPKRIIIGDPLPMSCRAGLEMQGGLCYVPCRTGYTGVGPVCWLPAPRNWVECGMGAAKDSLTCAKIIGNQVFSVGMVIVNIATFGSSASGSAAANSASKGPEFVKKLKEGFSKIKELYDSQKELFDALKTLKTAVKTAQTAGRVIDALSGPEPTDAEKVRLIAEIISLFDPTGLASVVAAYSYDICSNLRFA